MSGRFQLRERLGEGLYGEVYRAFDTDLARSVAVKFLRFTGASREHVVAHARALTCVSHHNVVGVYDVTTIVDPASGAPTDALVMELVDGDMLEDVLRHALTRNEARRIGAGIFDAIAAYHDRDLAHGDLHERNVMVGLVVKVFDPLQLDPRALATGPRAEQQQRDRRDVAYLAGKLLETAGVLGVEVRPGPLDAIRGAFEAALALVDPTSVATGKLTAYLLCGLDDERAAAWPRRYPDVALASAADWGTDPRTWPPVLATMSADRGEQAADWLIGSTLAEIDAKLSAPPPAIASWDGAPLVPGAVLHGRLMRPDEPNLLERMTRPGVAAVERPSFRDPIVEAAMAATAEARRGGTRPGVVVEGAPGSGKSVLSRQLEHELTRGALSALGHGVRRSARDLAADLAGGGGTWSAVLAIREPARRELFAALEAAGRLVPIVDGVDEVSPDRARAIAGWLRAGRGWWLATSRPMRALGALLPPAHRLRLEALSRADARRLLVALGREDLAEAVAPARGGEANPLILELSSTPLQVALLASVVPAGQDLGQLRPDTLYARAFAALLDHATLSRRLRADDAVLVRSLLASVVGELALAGLQTADDVLSAGVLDEVFEAAGVSPTDRARVIEALQFGHLLVPVAASWEFVHRTIAEWAAAAALRRRVDRALRGGPDTRARRAAAELAVLALFLDEDVLPAQSRWASLLRFYAPLAREPLVLLDRLLGPATVARRRRPVRTWGDERARAETRAASATEVLESWSYAYELMRLCTWGAADARTAWVIAVRRWLVSGFGETRRNFQRIAALRGFAEAVDAHLPRTLDELVALAARTPEEEEALAADPLVLLPAMPAVCAPALADKLARGAPAEQLAVIEWHLERKVAPSRAVLERLAEELPAMLEEATRRERARGADVRLEHAAEPRFELEHLEVAVWTALLAHGHEPPWDTVRRRFTEWSHHMEEPLRRWFASAPEHALRDHAVHRRAMLAWLIDRCVRDEQAIAAALAGVADPAARSQIVGRVRHSFDDAEEMHFQRVVDAIVAVQGWPRAENRYQPIDGPDRDAHERVAEAVRTGVMALHALRVRAAKLVGTLGDASLDTIAGELWASLPPGDPSRRELLRALGRRETVPRAIAPTDYLLEHGVDSWMLERLRWSPEQETQLRDAARTTRGRTRFVAVLAHAHATKSAELAALEAQFPTDDDAFADLAYEHRARRRQFDDARAPVGPLDPTRLSLSERAALDTPGWRDELLAQLAQDEPADRWTLIELAVRHEVRAALPRLVELLGRAEHEALWLVKKVVLLAGDTDVASLRAALRHALQFGWPAQSPAAVLAPLVRREDLALLEGGRVSAASHPTLRAAIRALGPDGIADLVALHARAPSDALAETILACLDPRHVPLAELVKRVLEFLDGDVHEVYGTPGPLGSDFDEPADLDWHSKHVNGALVQAAADALTAAVEDRPDDWPELRRLFRHPSELLRRRVFELCIQRCAPHEVASLALEALEGHALENRTRWEGQTMGLALASLHHGAGSVNIDAPATGSSLVAVVWNKLTVAHRALIESLSRHGVAQLRELAAAWIGARGTSDWLPVVTPLLEDGDPRVMAAAVVAIGRLGPGEVDHSLAAVEGRAWTERHDEALLAILRPQQIFEFDRGITRRTQPGLAAHVSESTLVRLLAMAGVRAAATERAADEPKEAAARHVRAGCFARFPSLADQLLETWPHPLGAASTALFEAWTQHASQPVRAVARRQLADRALLDPSTLKSLLAAPSLAERLSAAEAVVRMGVEALSAEALEAFDEVHTAVASWRAAAELGDAREVRHRLRSALQRATVAFAPALALVAADLPWDHSEGVLEPEGEAIIEVVNDCLRRWGKDGAIAFLALIEKGAIGDASTYRDELVAAAATHQEVLVALQASAKRGVEVATEALAQVSAQAFDRDLDGLARRLTDEVFPPGWPAFSGA